MNVNHWTKYTFNCRYNNTIQSLYYQITLFLTNFEDGSYGRGGWGGDYYGGYGLGGGYYGGGLVGWNTGFDRFGGGLLGLGRKSVGRRGYY